VGIHRARRRPGGIGDSVKKDRRRIGKNQSMRRGIVRATTRDKIVESAGGERRKKGESGQRRCRSARGSQSAARCSLLNMSNSPKRRRQAEAIREREGTRPGCLAVTANAEGEEFRKGVRRIGKKRSKKAGEPVLATKDRQSTGIH